ncbi:TIGR01777 family oxidoreductase [Prauserella cavernicola]|uniref:TIGR01777 family oxidoreductase n=1 Tax=Prauserella cavernicola TaxID=2800127 RepID=A0A934V2N6_9PSEU|nr:TIGR01777 family oxidoreductase [Prauserella cavernicola]MBK1786191.1 TIGR01777 family oxidoreductase [Prauserella cavernicola]
MRVIVAGSSGLIGSALVPRLREAGHEVLRLVRRDTRAGDERSWDPPAGRIDPGTFDGVDAVVNLCGAPLASGRWSGARKQVLTDSRIEPTEVLAEAVAEHGIGVLVNSSGAHYYGDTGEREADESLPSGTGFLPELCVSWEAATAPAAKAGARVVLLRNAPVLSGKGGLLGPLKPLFRFGLGGRLGDGTQYFPWISLPDQLAAIRFVLEHDDVRGPVNLSAPEPVTNAEFTRALGRALHRPAPWWVPGIALRVALGESADEMILSGPRAVPRRLLDAGFDFGHPGLDEALTAVL